ncbi:hypothetical protein F4802DRAFT_615724 [Xylaria palmicola]|nr:hypothetical protein F4802DRAFT_615724 [Xylaria palmicola]
MAQPVTRPGVAAINDYFNTELGFLPERYQKGLIFYTRVNAYGGIERIVVKPESVSGAGDTIQEEKFMLQLWGAEHCIRLYSVVSDKHHRAMMWNEPRNRYLAFPTQVIPWKLSLGGGTRYREAKKLHFFVMEYLPNGTGAPLVPNKKENRD